MTKDQILDLMVDDVAQRKKAIYDFVTDKSNSFEDRLEVFMKTPFHLQNRKMWIWHPRQYEAKYGELTWFENVVYDRHNTVDLQELVNALWEFIQSDLEEYDDWGYEYFDSDREKMHTMVNNILDECVHSFKFDW
jgi:hypothetical protein